MLLVKLVDRNAVPLGIQLVSANKVGKRQHSDLVQLAEEISKVCFSNITSILHFNTSITIIFRQTRL